MSIRISLVRGMQAQGLSLGQGTIIFEASDLQLPGQAYAALGRFSSSRCLCVRGLTLEKVIADPRAIQVKSPLQPIPVVAFITVTLFHFN